MSLLTKNSMPAERMRGCVFAEKFDSNAAVIANDGVIGAGAYVSDGKLICGGSGQATYPVPTYSSHWLMNNTVSIRIRCKLTDSSTVTFGRLFNFGTSVDDGFVIGIQPSTGDIRGGFEDSVNGDEYKSQTTIFSDLDYHELVYTWDGTTLFLYIDGAIMSDASSSVTCADTSGQIYIGGGGGYFQGDVDFVEIYHNTLTAQEVADFHNNATYNYRNKAVLDLPMGMAEHDPSHTTGTEILTDGDMEADNVTAWSNASNTATPTKQTTTPHGGTRCLRITSTADQSIYPTTDPFTTGKKYRLKGWVRSDGTVIPRLYNNGLLIWNGTISTSWQEFDFIHTAGRGEIQMRNTVLGYTEWDDMSVELVDARTLDVSGNSTHAEFGAGVAIAMPTKLTKHGYSFDGGDYLKTGAVTSLTQDITFATLLKKTANGAIAIVNTYHDYTEAVIRFHSTDAISFYHKGAQIMTTETYKNTELLFVCGTYEHAEGTKAKKIYVNGELLKTGAASVSPALTSGRDLYVGTRQGLAYRFNGEIYYSGAWNFALTELQVKDLHINLMKKVNDV